MCNADGTAMLIESCASPQLCQTGLSSGKCAVCMPGAQMCKGKDLMVCASDGQSFSSKDCQSIELCDETVGCMPRVCSADEVTCEGDNLKRCNPGSSGWDLVQACESGKCDKTNKTCRACTPGERKCSGDSVMVCDAQGQRFTTSACPGATPHCTASGMCVACLSDADCTESADCQTQVCSRGTCAPGKPTADFVECKTSSGASGLCSEGACAGLIAIRSAITENASTPYLNTQRASDRLSARGTSIGPWETFLRISSGNPTALRSWSTKQFVTLSSDGYVYANGGMSASSADRFTLSSGTIQVNGRYLQCGPNDGKPEAAQLRQSDSTTVGPWEGLSVVNGTWAP